MPRNTALAPALAAGLLLSLAMPQGAAAEEYSVVNSRDSFVQLVQGRELRRLGIRLTVTPTGQIVGRAFGTPVTGQWQWDGGYFCRDLFYGEEDLGFNCQLVEVNGGTLRFTSDQGRGMNATLRLQ